MKFFIKILKGYYKWIIIILLTLFLNIIYNKNFLSIKKGLDYKVINYRENMKVFIDRDYFDTYKSIVLQNKFLIQTNRHNKDSIYILNISSLNIFRPICEKNNNLIYKNDWVLIEEKVNIEGKSCTHSNVLYRSTNKFIIKLKPGGSVSADPIFIEAEGGKKWFVVLNKKK